MHSKPRHLGASGATAKKRWRLGGAVAVVGLVAAGLASTMASANLPGSTFEGNDGNFAVTTAGNTDWAGLNAQQQANLSVKADLLSGQTDNSFGNGTKTSDVNVSVVSGQIPNNKADLGNSYITSETLANGDVMMYLGITRVTTSGTVNLDIEVNQAAQPDLTTPGPKTLVRTAGDILINYDFQGGAQTPTLAIRTWTGTAWSAAQPVTGANGEAEVNRVPLANPLAVAPSPANAPAFTFGEAALNLTGLDIIEEGECAPFSTAYVKSRASDAFTSAVKDFIAPQAITLDNCGEIIVQKVTDPSPDPTDPDTLFPFTASYDADGFSLSNGQSNNSGDLAAGTYAVAETPVPANWTLTSFTCDDGSDPAAIDLGVNETVTCTATNTLNQGALAIHKDRKHAADGPGDHPHEGVSFSVSGVADPVVTDENGNACVEGLLPGDYTVTETVPAGYVSDDAEKPYTVVNGTTCATAVAVNFTNTPLTNVSVSVDSQVDGGTASTVDCTGTPVSTDANGDVTVPLNDLQPQTLTCEIVIDP
jgi:Prealbumin-like fold domain